MGKPNAVEMTIAHLPIPQKRGWWHQIDPKHQPTLNELEAAWKAGKLGRQMAPAANAISKTLQELGIATVQRQGVQNWLRRKA
ncbi:MAG: hypothetical protein EBR40_11535 [Proteobacteria bacterium]|nr:hypothetical protein [Pseudomonadota bacterium]